MRRECLHPLEEGQGLLTIATAGKTLIKIPFIFQDCTIATRVWIEPLCTCSHTQEGTTMVAPHFITNTEPTGVADAIVTLFFSLFPTGSWITGEGITSETRNTYLQWIQLLLDKVAGLLLPFRPLWLSRWCRWTNWCRWTSMTPVACLFDNFH